jgi:hypothetical protein
VIAVDVTYFVDSISDLKWAFKKLPKSIPEALKKVTVITVISKEYFDVAQYRLLD